MFTATHEGVPSYRTHSHSAPGPDFITSWMLCTFAEELAPSITSMFNHSLEFGGIPMGLTVLFIFMILVSFT